MRDGLENRLNTIYKTHGDREGLDNAYDEWARDYDQDICSSGNPRISLIAGLAARYIPDRNAHILDGGCGTGQLGEILDLIGFSNIVGIDASDGMLAAAKAKDCYGELHKLLLGSKIDLPDESFDAVTAAGVLTHGHAPAESLDGIIRIAKPGAPIIFSLSEPAFNENGFGAKIQELDDAGLWTLEEQTKPFRTYPFSEQFVDLRHWISVYRKTG
jgi:ubiquinone/menaquinone biosynthesis C-methylase UbiE